MPSAPSGHNPCVYLYDNKTISVSILCGIPLCKAVCKCDLVNSAAYYCDLHCSNSVACDNHCRQWLPVKARVCVSVC